MLAEAVPPATMVSQIAIVYKKDAVLAEVYDVIGVIACILTMPLMIRLFEYLF